jgi:hypothetical protein
MCLSERLRETLRHYGCGQLDRLPTFWRMRLRRGGMISLICVKP